MGKVVLSFLEIINASTEYLKKRGVPNPKCDVEWIVATVTSKKRVELYLEFENPVEEKFKDKIRKWIIDRGKRIPLQHILGNVNFAGNNFFCDKRALIPRPETEYFTELILERIENDFSGNILDLGTGGGAIIITLCIQKTNCKGTGLDKSKVAIELAKKNAQLHKMTNIKFGIFDWCKEKLKNEYDIIVSNPPYLTIEEWESAETEVKVFDPKSALVADEGTSDLIKIINIAEVSLSRGGLLALEIGLYQKNRLLDEMHNKFTHIEIVKDFSNKDRFIFGRKL